MPAEREPPDRPVMPAGDPGVAAFAPDVDRTLLRRNLTLTPDERIRKLQSFVSMAVTLREAGRKASP